MSAIFGEVLTFGQQNGPDVRLKVYGDEHYSRHEDLDGYTVVYDFERGLFCYARLAADRFRSTGVPISEPPPAGLVRHLQEPDVVQIAKAEARRIAKTPVGIDAEERVVRTFGPNQGLLEGRQLSIGAVKGLTILVNFQDVRSTVTREDIDAMLNGANYTTNGNICSVREYFNRMSSGMLDYTNVVAGPYTLSRNRQFYVNTLLVEEALSLAVADGINLAQFDSRHDGILDALNVLYAGQTQYLGELWPHNYFINLRHGNVRTNLYLLTSLGRTPADLSIGTFCHENGHLLCRFPDMYDYGERDGDSVRSAGIGSYCLMGSGNHLDAGRSPSPVCAYLRDLAGWCDNEVNLNVNGAFEARHGDYNSVLKFRTSKRNEYFLVENRSRMNMDRALPASGLAVYHCDIFGSNERQEGTAARHYQCALLQADGHRDLELNVNTGDGSDLFGQAAGLVLSSQSSPHTREWDGRDSTMSVSNISSPGPAITFDLGQPAIVAASVGEARPMLQIPDNRTAGVASVIPIAASGIVRHIKVSIDIEHSYIGDLRVELLSPTGRRATLHAQTGGSRDNVVITYESTPLGALSVMIGQPMQGDWMLRVSDRAAQDVGTLRTWKLELSSNPAGLVADHVTIG
jgi:M6 family metalloprotease-like protein